jgi:hypothetical protein
MSSGNVLRLPDKAIWTAKMGIEKIIMKYGNDNIHVYNREPHFCQHTPLAKSPTVLAVDTFTTSPQRCFPEVSVLACLKVKHEKKKGGLIQVPR